MAFGSLEARNALSKSFDLGFIATPHRLWFVCLVMFRGGKQA
jgi:hypothetical protein